MAALRHEAGAGRSANWALEAEKIHAQMYSAARTAVQEGHDAQVGPVYVCEV